MLVALAVVLGLSTPPVDSCLRAILPAVIRDREALRAAYAAESAAVELTWIVGPPLVLLVGVAWSTSAALVVAGAVLVAGTAVFAAQPASRAWRPAPAPERPRGGSLRAPAMRTLVLLLVFVGVVFGTVEVAVIAAVADLGSPAQAGLLLGVWGAGSLTGGIVAARMGGGRAPAPASRSCSPHWRRGTSLSPRPWAVRSRWLPSWRSPARPSRRRTRRSTPWSITPRPPGR